MLDVLVVGAGPAGCAAAIQARRAGLKVAIVEVSETLRSAPGETLHPGIEPLFEQLGIREAVLGAGFHRHRGIWISWDGPRRFEAYGADASGPWLGFQAARRRLHAILQGAARNAGAELRLGIAADGLIVADGRVEGIIADGRELRARWTADATGRRAFVARALRLEVRNPSPRLTARFGWSETGDDAAHQPEITATAEGWEWRAFLGAGRTAWVHVSVDDRAGSRPRPGTDVSWRYHPACAGPGYILLGDAAVTLDPASSHGVLRALMSGILCTHLIVRETKGGSPANSLTSDYRAWITGQFQHDAHELRALYGRHPSSKVAGLFAAVEEAHESAAPEPMGAW